DLRGAAEVRSEIELEIPDPTAPAAPIEPEPEPVDLVERLRDMLGWGESSAAQADEGSPGTTPVDPGSPQVVLDAPDAQPAVVARETPLGRYLAGVEADVVRRWYEAGLDPLVVALGVDREVTLTFRVRRSGRVDAPTLLVSSGDPEVDRAALASVPDRLPRFPSDLDLQAFTHRLTLRYKRGP
ncbi:MAG TPA: energy transducer TonB, partial [Myxococcota bacterium]|nr:energy transducer TonB [Myxococcota bacterium]